MSSLNFKTAVVNQSEAMEFRNHLKNGASPKSHTSRINLFLIIFCGLFVFSCGQKSMRDTNNSTILHNQTKAVTETGEEVILFNDGTWKYLNNDDSEKIDISTNSKIFKKDEGSTFLLKSNTIKIGCWINPQKWSFKKSEEAAEFEFELKKSDLYGMIITERTEIPIQTLKRVALENARSAAPDAEIVKEEYRNVNGLNVLLLQINGTIEGIKFTYYGYYYSNSDGTVQLITYTAQKLLSEYLIECEKFLNGLVEIK